MHSYTSRITTSLALVGAMAFLAGSAQAASTFTMEWNLVGTNSDVFDKASDTCDLTGTIRPGLSGSGTACSANILLSVGSEGLSLLGVSFVYDADLANEANFIGGFEGAFTLLGKANSMGAVVIGLELSTESSDSSAGFVRRFDLSAPAPPAPGVTTTNSPTAITIGTIAFAINSANGVTDGVDIDLGLTDAGTDGAFDSLNVDVAGSTLTPGGLSINNGPAVPEPTTTALMVLGLAGLGYVSRRSLH